MDMAEAFRGEDIAKTDFFDFVVAPDVETQHALSFNRTLKSMGIYIENQDNLHHAATPAPSHDVSSAAGAASSPVFSDAAPFWASPGASCDKELDDLAPYCWGHDVGDAKGHGNTDGAIYTLTVLNGGADHAATWYRPPEATPAVKVAAAAADLDLDSILNIIPPQQQQQQPPPSFPPAAATPYDHAAADAFNNNDWKLSDGNGGVESLLRSALQGKAPPRNDAELRRVLSTPPAPDHNSSSGASSVDDLLLSQLDAASYPEDYEKLKRIATEVAQYCGSGGNAFLGAATPPPVSATTTPPPPPSSQPRAKKYAKKPSGGGAGAAPGGARKERSLHYCSICSKGFKDKYSVNVHIRTHTGEKPFACSLCGKSFRQKAHLAKHYQTHVAHKSGSAAAAPKQRFKPS